MNIARYTRALIQQLTSNGECREYVGWRVTESVARTRIYHAARLAGLRVSTHVEDGRYGREVVGIVKESTDD